jgi:hypothetical protein
MAEVNAHSEVPGHHPAEPTALGLDAPGWVALAMILVFAIAIWKRVPAIVGKLLDDRIALIRAQLDNAEQLRKEAEALKAEYEAKSAAADAEAAAMVARALVLGRLGDLERLDAALLHPRAIGVLGFLGRRLGALGRCQILGDAAVARVDGGLDLGQHRPADPEIDGGERQQQPKELRIEDFAELV